MVCCTALTYFNRERKASGAVCGSLEKLVSEDSKPHQFSLSAGVGCLTGSMLDGSFGCTGGCCSTCCSTEACEGAGGGFRKLIFFVVCLFYSKCIGNGVVRGRVVLDRNDVHDGVLIIMLQGV